MKSIPEKTIKKYLPNLKIKAHPIKLKNLPAFYRSIYDFEELHINEKQFLVISVKDKELGPKDFKKHSRILKEAVNLPQIWYLKELHFNKVQRMIENSYNFVVENKQIHLPSVHISIKPEVEKIETLPTSLIGMSVNMLVREVLKGDLSGKSKVEIAELFKTTKMSAGRALKPLLAHGLCTEEKLGVAKHVQFKERSFLWQYLKKKVHSPVKKVMFIDKAPKALPYSGISALSRQSMLAGDELETYAAEKKFFKKQFSKTSPVLEEFAKAKVELWDRLPILMEKNCVNIIDIFLVNKEEADERVQIELQELLKKYDLGMDEA